jgi:TatD DNase family protein
MPPRTPVDPALVPRLPPGCTVIDSHCHLDMDDLAADRAGVLERARHAGVATMITIGAGGPMECNHAAVRMAARHDQVVAAVGTHPHDATTVDDHAIGVIRALAENPGVVAIGESGLDYHYDNSPRAVQRDAFRRFAALARGLKLPLVVHLREADDDALAILREEHASETGGVIHCFSSSADRARQFLDLGFYLSFSGIVTFKSADAIREAARVTPADRILVETDAPFLAPIPFRGRRNEPALVVQTARCLAELRGETIEVFARRSAENTRRLFRLGPPRGGQ